jgi:hypothetical protein
VIRACVSAIRCAKGPEPRLVFHVGCFVKEGEDGVFLETAGVLAIARDKIREGRKEDSKTGEDGQIVQMTRSTHRKEW